MDSSIKVFIFLLIYFYALQSLTDVPLCYPHSTHARSAHFGSYLKISVSSPFPTFLSSGNFPKMTLNPVIVLVSATP